MDNIDKPLADINPTRMEEDQPTNDARVDESIARLLQTVKEVNALITTAPTVKEEPDTMDDASESSDLDSSSSSDSDMEDEDDRANMLKMIADGDDDDEDQAPNNSVPATRNEVLDPQIPELTMTELPATAQLTSLGTIHSIVDNSVIIQANISGERHVLDAESILSFDDRKVLGLVYDVFGPVSRPMYTVRFRGEIDRESVVVGRGVFFSPGWVKMLATEKLRVKGTDASNEYDEEVGDDGMEFSDDEEERIHRRQVKKCRQQAAHNRTQNAAPSVDSASTPSAAPRSSVPPPLPSAVSNTPAAPQNARKLQSYQDLYDADLGF
ncbi:hypothetical protein GGH94_004127 [Coemansia aciculifera]|uniref:H/ACA ribonucleoprotein complex subunit n=2 Tax=Coemansia TaxID=4863 RepID=A0A9W8IKY7_9FUNG|nr:hypothetical protein GGH94_004127 [Coemansia aciculifera]KAJ2872490.1 hypothetical protein GGH93_003969 [Coemansia aciculifera]